MYPPSCKYTLTKGTIQLYKGTTLVTSTTFDDSRSGSGFIRQENLAAGTYTIKFQPTWGTVDVKDYLIAVYAPEAVTITDAAGKSNPAVLAL